MFIDKNECVVFSIFDTDNLKKIETALVENQRSNYKLFYENLNVENDIIVKRGGAHFPKVTFFKPESANVIVQYSNYHDGLITLSNYLSNKLNEPFYQFSFSNPISYYKGYSFQRHEKGEIARVVYAMQDPKWIFYEQGEVLPFEDKSNYDKKRIAERLNKKIIIEYCSRLGFDIANDNFWESSELALFYECIGWK